MTLFQEIGREARQTEKPATTFHRSQQLWGWFFISPWIIGFILFSLLPIVASLYFSFTDFNLTSDEPMRFIGLENWRVMLFEDTDLRDALEATLRFSVIALPLAIGLPVLLATLLNSPYLIGKRIWRTLFYMPYMVPVVSAVYIWGGMLNADSGWINRFLEAFGIMGPDWLFDPVAIYAALNIIGLWGIGNAMLITLAAMQGVPTELYEAVKVDGGNAWTGWRQVTLPLISPVIFYNLVLSIIGLFRYFDIPFILKEGTGEPENLTLFLNIHLYREAFVFQDMGYGSALAWLLFILALAATMLIFYSARYWVYYSSEA